MTQAEQIIENAKRNFEMKYRTNEAIDEFIAFFISEIENKYVDTMMDHGECKLGVNKRIVSTWDKEDIIASILKELKNRGWYVEKLNFYTGTFISIKNPNDCSIFEKLITFLIEKFVYRIK